MRWSPGIGDPSLLGWFTVVLYLLAAVLSLRVYRQANRMFARHTAQQRLFWISVAVLLLLLAINKQLDLQSLLTDIGRMMARKQGWYRERDQVQILFVIALGIACVITMTGLIYYFRKILVTNFIALAGLTLLVFFIMVRAVSFHYADIFLRSQILGIKLYQLVEMGGILLVALNACGLLYLSRQLQHQIPSAPRPG